MKLTFFTISNEQIKEQLSKLQTKVESLENMKELQDKVISMQDHQISFLNDSIANMWAPIGIVAGLAGLIITGAFAYVTFLNGNAQKKIKQAAEIIEQSESMTLIAQEKINELETKQIELNEFATSLSKNQRMDMSLKNIDIELGFINNLVGTLLFAIQELFEDEKTEANEKYNSYKIKYLRLKKAYTDFTVMFNTKIIKDKIIDQQDENKINKLEAECFILRQDIQDYLEQFQEND